jgi:hypothetical protein
MRLVVFWFALLLVPLLDAATFIVDSTVLALGDE